MTALTQPDVDPEEHREPANAAELHAAAIECAEASVAMYAARQAAGDAWTAYLADDDSDEGVRSPLFIAFEAAAATETAAVFRHRNSVTAYAAIRPDAS